MTYIERHLSYSDTGEEKRKTIHELALVDLILPAVILGEPGMGKSALLRALATRDTRYELTSALKLKRRHTPVAPGKILLIDGLDELPGARGQDPIQDVLEKLGQLGSPPFFLSCRANDWRSVAKQSIHEDYGRTPTEYRLEALTREEAVAFLTGHHGEVSAREFVTGMDRQGISEFYGNPFTLKLVDRLAASAEGLPQDRANLYARASETLRQDLAEGRDTAPLSALSSEVALDAVGGACAALILTGSEAINVGAQGATQEGDLHLSEVTALPGVAALPTAISCMIFERREGQGDRLAPFHRAMAEFLAARWIARQADDVSGRRLLAMMTHEGGVPASIRGVHAWLAYFSQDLRAAVIAADPYGVLRSGDAAYLTPTDAQALLRALESLSEADPWFATGDGRHHRAPALTQIAMANELRRVLLASQSVFQLKSILLLALPGAEAAPALAADLEAIYISPEPTDVASEGGHPGYSYHERAAAADVLIPLLDRTSWMARVETLLLRPGEDDRRLAVETITTVGSEHFAPRTIARAALAYVGLLVEVGIERRDVSTYGDLLLLTQAIGEHQAGAVLDAIVEAKPPGNDITWRTSWELSGLIDRLIVNALPLSGHDPSRVLAWLRLVDRHHRSDRDAQKTIQDFFSVEVALRRAIQRHVVLVEARATRSIDWIWSLHELDAKLGFTEDDVLDILTPANLPDMADTHWRETFERLVAERRTTKGLPPAIAAAARAMAACDVELGALIDRLDQRNVPDYLYKDKIRKWRERARARKRKIVRQAGFQKLTAHIAEGAWTGLAQAAEVYFSRFSDLDRDASPRSRLVGWVGDDLADQMLAGFEVSFHRADLPTPEAVGESYVGNRFWSATRMLMAAVCERARAGRDLEGLPEEAVISAAAGEILEQMPDALSRAMRGAFDRWFTSRPAAWERKWRAVLEPQLRAGRQHVIGLHRFLNPQTRDPRRARFATEWLTRFPNLPAEAEYELLDAMTREGDWATLLALLAARETLGYRDDDHRLTWLAAAFFADFEGVRAKLDIVAVSHPALFWSIRGRGWPSDERGHGRALDIAPLAWLIRRFRGPFPCVGRPMTGTSGRSNAWDAAEFLQAMIQRLAVDTSDAAVAVLASLRDEVVDNYTPYLKNACAQQLRARRDAGFAPMALSQLTAVLGDRPPTSAADLQALVLDALDTVQARMNRDAEGQVEMFYEGATPKGEEACRDVLVILLRDLVGHGIDVTSEHRMPGGTRADIVFAREDLRLPLEAKGQWHAELWKAADTQLDAYYAIEWRARNLGIYLVFWFGPDTPDNKALQSPGRGKTRPTTPEELREALVVGIAEHRRGQIKVVVLDVRRLPSASLVPTRAMPAG